MLRGHKFDPGFNPALAYMTHIWEPLQCNWRPAAFYMMGEVMAGLKHVLLLAAGFTCWSWNSFTYYTRDIQSPTAVISRQSPINLNTPLLFCHGVGAGLLPYFHWLVCLAATGHPVLAMEYRHLAMRWTSFMPTVEDVAEAMADVLQQHGVRRMAVIGHRYACRWWWAATHFAVLCV